MTRYVATIRAWHPTMSANGSHGHWSTAKKKHDVDQGTAWATAKYAGWKFIPGQVRLTITLVYPRKYRVDADNLTARCKGVIDGLKAHASPWVKPRPNHPILSQPIGFFEDDSTDVLELHVKAIVEPGVKETRLELQSVGEP